MEINGQIDEIVNFVDSKCLKDSSYLGPAQQNLTELEKELENLALLFESKLDTILREKFKHEQQIERLLETYEKTNKQLQDAKMERNDALSKENQVNEDLKVAQENLKAVETDLKTFETEVADVQKQLENVPKLSENKKLMYQISRLTFDVTKKDNIIKGFVINPIKEDVRTFSFNTKDSGVSSHFITNYIWDLIAAGNNEKWDKF